MAYSGTMNPDFYRGSHLHVDERLGLFYDPARNMYYDVESGYEITRYEIERRMAEIKYQQRDMYYPRYNNRNGTTADYGNGTSYTTISSGDYCGGGGGNGFMVKQAPQKYYIEESPTKIRNLLEEKKIEEERNQKILLAEKEKKRKFKNLYWHRRAKERDKENNT